MLCRAVFGLPDSCGVVLNGLLALNAADGDRPGQEAGGAIFSRLALIPRARARHKLGRAAFSQPERTALANISIDALSCLGGDIDYIRKGRGSYFARRVLEGRDIVKQPGERDFQRLHATVFRCRQSGQESLLGTAIHDRRRRFCFREGNFHIVRKNLLVYNGGRQGITDGGTK